MLIIIKENEYKHFYSRFLEETIALLSLHVTRDQCCSIVDGDQRQLTVTWCSTSSQGHGYYSSPVVVRDEIGYSYIHNLRKLMVLLILANR